MQANNTLCHSKRDLFPQSFYHPPSLYLFSTGFSFVVLFLLQRYFSMASNFSTIFVHKFQLGFISFFLLLLLLAVFMLHEQHLFMFHFYHACEEGWGGCFSVGASKTSTFFSLIFLIYTHIKLYFATIKFGDKFYFGWHIK